MRTPLAILAVLALIAGNARAEELFADQPTIAEEDLLAQRGGTDTPTEINGSVLQNNNTTQTSTNSGNSVSVGDGAIKANGSIREATVNGNHGITAVMQNTGDLVNMSNATSVNVFLK